MNVLILVIPAGHFKANGFLQNGFEWSDVPMRGPQLELGIARRAEPREIIVIARKEVDAGERLRVAPVEPLGQPYHRRKRPDRPSQWPRQIAEAFVRLLRGGLPVVPCQQRDDLDLARIEAAQISILDQIIRMTMVAFVADVDADIVQQGAIFQPLAFPV
jgi:hypothetical protein